MPLRLIATLSTSGGNRKRVGAMKGYACQIVVDEAVTWLEEKRDGKTPFFLNIWFHEPHAPLAAPDEIVSQYGELNDQAAIYSGTVDNTDRAISRLLKKLKQLGALENTIIIYMSDHGSYRQDRNGELRGIKRLSLRGRDSHTWNCLLAKRDQRWAGRSNAGWCDRHLANDLWVGWC